jgi:hypothetical protein
MLLLLRVWVLNNLAIRITTIFNITTGSTASTTIIGRPRIAELWKIVVVVQVLVTRWVAVVVAVVVVDFKVVDVRVVLMVVVGVDVMIQGVSLIFVPSILSTTTTFIPISSGGQGQGSRQGWRNGWWHRPGYESGI